MKVLTRKCVQVQFELRKTEKMWLAAIIVLAIVCLLLYLDSAKPKNFPPGPRWIPILGCGYEVGKLKDKFGALPMVMGEYFKRYGALIGLKIGRERIVFCYGSRELKEFLSNEDLNGRPTGLFYELRTRGRRGILLTDEDFWMEQRRFVLRHMREFGFGKRSMSEFIELEAVGMVNHLKKMMGKNKEVTVQMNSMFGIYVLNTLWTMLAGTKYSPEDKNLVYLQDLLNNLFRNCDIIGALFSQFPFLRYILPEFSGYNLYMKSHEPIWDFINKEIQNHKQTYETGISRDFIDVYLEMQYSKKKPPNFTEDQLLAICLDFFMAGSETTTKSLGFCFLYLLLNPEVQRKAQEEIDRVVGRDRIPSLTDRPNMPYVEAMVLETLRHFMGRTLGLPHRALRDSTICGYNIPKDTMIVPCFHGICFGSEGKFSDPFQFQPERFLHDGQVKVPDLFIPFGFGKRRCLGETLARGNLFIFIATMLQNFNVKVPEGEDPPSTDAVDGVTAGTRPFKGVVQLRE